MRKITKVYRFFNKTKWDWFSNKIYITKPNFNNFIRQYNNINDEIEIITFKLEKYDRRKKINGWGWRSKTSPWKPMI